MPILYERRWQLLSVAMDAIGTAPLLDLLDLPKTTGNARRVGAVMRVLGFVPIKTRRFNPGGYRQTVTRGWVRPVRELSFKQGGEVRIPVSHAKPGAADQPMEVRHVQ